MMKVYLAGPDVFLPNAVEVGKRKKELCKSYGFQGLFPFDNEIPPSAKGERVDRLIYRANERMMRSADFGIFNLTPFRGPSGDAGTVFELGFMVGLGKRVLGYTNATSDYFERVKECVVVEFDASHSTWRDSNGMNVEQFGNVDNLMIDWAIAEHGGQKIVKPRAMPLDTYRDLTGFEACLRFAAEKIAKSA